MTEATKRVLEFIVAEQAFAQAKPIPKTTDFYGAQHARHVYIEILKLLLEAEQAPILQALEASGENVLRLTANQLQVKDKPSTLDILVEHIHKPYSPYTRSTLAFCLMSMKLKGTFSTLFEFYRREPVITDGWPISLVDVKSALAYAACSVAKPQNLDEILIALYDAGNGRSRTVLLATIECWHDPRVDKALADLADDPECAQLVERTYIYRAKRAKTGARIAIAKQIGSLG